MLTRNVIYVDKSNSSEKSRKLPGSFSLDELIERLELHQDIKDDAEKYEVRNTNTGNELQIEHKHPGFIVPDEILKSTHMSLSELILEITIMLYQKEKLTLGQASQFAAMSQFQFQRILASRGIYIY
ncbi:UPF0175 family protein [candidate division KSB1 bacterium]|nr:UPF0175 family protein [candidate division KSB1 bacterium]